MKVIKNLLAMLLAFSALLPAYALAAPEPSGDTATDMELINQSGTIIDSMIQLCSLNGYVDAFSASDELKALTSEALGYDYSNANRSLVVRVEADALTDIISGLTGVSIKSSDEALTELMLMKLMAAPFSQRNAYQGVNWLAASSILTASNVLSLTDVPPCMAYVISEYSAENQPLTYAAFGIKNDGLTMVCSGLLKLSDETRAALFENEGANFASVLFNSMDFEPNTGAFYQVYDMR